MRYEVFSHLHGGVVNGALPSLTKSVEKSASPFQRPMHAQTSLQSRTNQCLAIICISTSRQQRARELQLTLDSDTQFRTQKKKEEKEKFINTATVASPFFFLARPVSPSAKAEAKFKYRKSLEHPGNEQFHEHQNGPYSVKEPGMRAVPGWMRACAALLMLRPLGGWANG